MSSYPSRQAADNETGQFIGQRSSKNSPAYHSDIPESQYHQEPFEVRIYPVPHNKGIRPTFSRVFNPELRVKPEPGVEVEVSPNCPAVMVTTYLRFIVLDIFQFIHTSNYLKLSIVTTYITVNSLKITSDHWT